MEPAPVPGAATTAVLRAVRASSIAEVCWVDPDGRPGAAGVLSLTRQERPVLALTWDRRDLAERLSRAGTVVLVIREPRGTGSGWAPVALRAVPGLIRDAEGDVYLEDLILQELRRYPPARRYADSPLLCREHWWYLPRLVVTLEPAGTLTDDEEAEPLAVPAHREDHRDATLVTGTPGEPVVASVRLEDWAGTVQDLDVRSGQVRPGPAVLLAQDASFPDLEVWERWTWAGEVGPATRGLARFTGAGEAPRVVAPAGPTLRARWRTERRFGAACRAALAAEGAP